MWGEIEAHRLLDRGLGTGRRSGSWPRSRLRRRFARRRRGRRRLFLLGRLVGDFLLTRGLALLLRGSLLIGFGFGLVFGFGRAGLGEDREVADVDLVLGLDHLGTGDLLAVDEGSVGRLEIDHHHPPIAQHDLGVLLRDVALGQNDVVVVDPTDEDLRLVEVQPLGLPALFGDGDLDHRWPVATINRRRCRGPRPEPLCNASRCP